MADFDHDRHRYRLLDAVAVADELLDPDDDLAQIRDEYADAHHCKDEALRKRVDAEASKRERAAAKLASCFALLREAGSSESEELSVAATDELRRTVMEEFTRRGGDADKDNP